VRVRVLDADDQNPAFYFDKYAAQIPAETGQGVKLQVKCDHCPKFKAVDRTGGAVDRTGGAVDRTGGAVCNVSY
jgi:hypothetical protein